MIVEDVDGSTPIPQIMWDQDSIKEFWHILEVSALGGFVGFDIDPDLTLSTFHVDGFTYRIAGIGS